MVLDMVYRSEYHGIHDHHDDRGAQLMYRNAAARHRLAVHMAAEARRKAAAEAPMCAICGYQMSPDELPYLTVHGDLAHQWCVEEEEGE